MVKLHLECIILWIFIFFKFNIWAQVLFLLSSSIHTDESNMSISPARRPSFLVTLRLSPVYSFDPSALLFKNAWTINKNAPLLSLLLTCSLSPNYPVSPSISSCLSFRFLKEMEIRTVTRQSPRCLTDILSVNIYNSLTWAQELHISWGRRIL